jgi:UDP-glucose 4-epimerase
MSTESILVPGGLGYVGSHTILQLFAQTKMKIIIVDDLSNCDRTVLDKVKTILIN